MTHEPATNAAQIAVDPISAASPDMSAVDLAALTESIKTQGQLVPIVMHEGRVIDGRKRLSVCQSLGIDPKVIELAGDVDATAIATALNLLRTHYSAAQRAMFVSRLATLTHEDAGRIARGRDRLHKVGLTYKEAAALGGVDPSTVSTAKRIRHQAAPEVVAAVESGTLSLRAARKTLPDSPADEGLSAPVKDPQARHPLNRGKRHVHADQIVERAAHMLEGVALGFQDLDANNVDPTRRAEWAASLHESIRVIARVVKEMRNVEGK